MSFMIGNLLLIFTLLLLPFVIIIIDTKIKTKKSNSYLINKQGELKMKYCITCGAELHDNAVICPKCGCATPQYKKDESSIGLNIVSFLFPIIGLFLYLAFHSEHPIKAKGCGKWALISFIINIFITIISIIIGGL